MGVLTQAWNEQLLIKTNKTNPTSVAKIIGYETN